MSAPAQGAARAHGALSLPGAPLEGAARGREGPAAGTAARPAPAAERPPTGPEPAPMAETEGLFALVKTLHDPAVKLGTFVRFLQDSGILPQDLRYTYEQQERMQKCAYIAQEGFGLNLGYRHHLNAYGTFSTTLAIDFSEIVRGEAPLGSAPMPPRFGAGEFTSLVSGRTVDWLCVASAVVHERGSRGPRALASHVDRITDNYGRRLVRRVVADVGSALPLEGGHD